LRNLLCRLPFVLLASQAVEQIPQTPHLALLEVGVEDDTVQVLEG
jgi:hypothetical protein